MTNKRDLTFAQMFNLSFGFFGVQIAYALQSANISRIFATLGADPHQLSFFWILPPLMGMIVQPLIGKWSDRTWTRMGRRKPYLLVGAIVAVLVMLLLPKAGSLNLSTAYLFLGLNSAMWFGLFSLIFLDTSINVAMQPFKMMVGDLVNEKQKATAYSIQSFLCNAGSLVGYLFPIFFTWIGIANTAPEGVVPDSVIYSFWCGAAILIVCVLYTFMKVKEMPPKEYAEFHGIDPAKTEEKKSEGLLKLLVKAPKTFWTVGLVQFFCWAAFLYMWTYTNGAIAHNCWGTSDTASAAYQAAGNWVGVLFAVQAVGSILWALVIPRFKNLKLAYVVSLLAGAAGFASVMFIHNQYLLFVSYFLIGFAWAAMLALPFTFLTNALEGNPYMGSYLGLFNCTICLPQIVAAATGGAVISLVGGSQGAMLLLAGVFLVLGACSVALVKTKQTK
ncbi:MAG: SLC45 family MFS transporter [Bacteroidales bacterium]|nr:SLC45 family MFS transporter [Bacteroidales bacterium]MBQ2107544.1 SLC45 family MFS transporter [Bacteroidales bacterium]MBQ2162180.1 SLC45 family MFS transporter [Bacteroidales bacterium]